MLLPVLTPIWQRQPVVLIGAALDPDAKADIFRQSYGLSDLTCLKFAPHRQHNAIRLYLPDHLPLPNTPQFQAELLLETRRLLTFVKPSVKGPTVILVDDLPLKQQLAANLAAEFGSRVQVDQPLQHPDAILVSGWKFWHHHRPSWPSPGLLIIATLPLPSLENPLVAGAGCLPQTQASGLVSPVSVSGCGFRTAAGGGSPAGQPGHGSAVRYSGSLPQLWSPSFRSPQPLRLLSEAANRLAI